MPDRVPWGADAGMVDMTLEFLYFDRWIKYNESNDKSEVWGADHERAFICFSSIGLHSSFIRM